jgi:hypothetical protein
LDLLPRDKRTFLPPRERDYKDFPQSNPYKNKVKHSNPHTELSVDKTLTQGSLRKVKSYRIGVKV